MRVLTWLELVEQSDFSKVRGERLKDYLSLVTQASRKAQPDSHLPFWNIAHGTRVVPHAGCSTGSSRTRHSEAGVLKRMSLAGEGLR